MGKYAGHKYNGAIDRINVSEDKKYIVNGGQGRMFVHNIFDPIPNEFYDADYVVVDPPWNMGNLRTFYTKAELKLDKEFEQFLDRIFQVIREIGVNSCYMEFGFQFKDEIARRMSEIFDHVRVIDSFYYRTKPCHFIIGENEGHVLDFDTTPKDELKVIDEIIKLKEGRVLDFCLGRGAVSRTAYKYGKDFIGSELNINRFAVSLEDIMKKGANITEIEK